ELVVALREARKLDRDSKDLAGLIMFLSEKTRAREAWIRDPTEGPGGMRRWKTIEALHKSVARWQHFNPDGTLKDYLRLVALDGKSTAVDEETDEVTLLTLHASKGLEWPICFMVGCQEGLIPHQRTLEDPRADVSEERRLFYVGITRAKRTCFLTLSQVRRRFHGTEPTRPSRFLAEIPPESRVDVDRAKGAGTVDRSEQKRRFSEIRDRLRKR
ncbi:MAG: superfamily I DNA/RNA helicase, partial [Myxococcota bacterium]